MAGDADWRRMKDSMADHLIRDHPNHMVQTGWQDCTFAAMHLLLKPKMERKRIQWLLLKTNIKEIYLPSYPLN